MAKDTTPIEERKEVAQVIELIRQKGESSVKEDVLYVTEVKAKDMRDVYGVFGIDKDILQRVRDADMAISTAAMMVARDKLSEVIQEKGKDASKDIITEVSLSSDLGNTSVKVLAESTVRPVGAEPYIAHGRATLRVTQKHRLNKDLAVSIKEDIAKLMK